MAQARRSPRVRAQDPWFRLRVLAAVALAILGLGTAGYMLLEDASLIDAFYMTLITLTTVGFGEVIELDAKGRLFTIALIGAGVVGFATTVALMAQLVQEGALGERGRQRRMQKKIDHMTDHYIVCGLGRVGRAVAAQLASEGVGFVIIDRGERDSEDVRTMGYPYELGDATQESVLIAAGVERARGLVCALPDDPDNVFIALAARSINPDITIVSRLSDPTAAPRLVQAGVDKIVSPYETSGRHMARAAMEKD